MKKILILMAFALLFSSCNKADQIADLTNSYLQESENPSGNSLISNGYDSGSIKIVANFSYQIPAGKDNVEITLGIPENLSTATVAMSYKNQTGIKLYSEENSTLSEITETSSHIAMGMMGETTKYQTYEIPAIKKTEAASRLKIKSLLNIQELSIMIKGTTENGSTKYYTFNKVESE